MQQRLERQTTKNHRRGSVYILVLGTSVLVAVIGISAVLAVRVQRRVAQEEDHFAVARNYATGGVELGLLWIDNDPNWRTTYSSGVWVADRTIGSGSFTLEGIDPIDGDLSDSPSDPLLLIGTGMRGEAKHKTQITLTAQAQPLDCLEVAMCAGGDITFNRSTMVNCDQTIHTNGSATADTADVQAKIEAASSVTGCCFNPMPSNGVQPRALPGTSVFDYYILAGTAISFASIPQVQGKATIEKTVLAAATNPYGPISSNGIYVIDCAGQDLRIRDARIEATIVILDPAKLVLERSLSWKPPNPNWPALLVRGKAEFLFDNTPLAENGEINYNPPAVPYDGNGDADLIDSFPSIIEGLIYVSDSLNTDNHPTISGLLLSASTVSIKGTFDLIYNDIHFKNPPPSFLGDSQVAAITGSWRQLVD